MGWGVGGEATMYCQLFSPLPVASGCPLNTDRQMPVYSPVCNPFSMPVQCHTYMCGVTSHSGSCPLTSRFSNPDMEL